MLRRASLFFGLLGVLAARPASAESPANPTAQQLFDEGRALVAAGRYTEACPKFEETLRLEGGIGAKFNLADCYEHVGRSATAWALFREAAGAAALAGQADRERVAIARASALEARLCRLRVEPDAVKPGGASFRVTRDGALIGEAQWGVPIAVDPGTHRVAVDGPRIEPWEAEVRVAGCPNDVTVHVPLRPTAETSPPSPARVEPVAARGTPRAEPPPAPPGSGGPRPGRPWQRVAGTAAAIGGAVVLSAGAVALGYALKRKADSDASCTNGVCHPDGLDARSDAVHAGNIATVLTATGALVLAVGVTLFVWPTPGPRRVGTLTLGSQGLAFDARF